LLAGAALLLMLVEVVGWNVVAYSKFTRALEGANPREQLLFIASNPLLFVGIIARDIWAHSLSYMQGWIGVYGYDYWPVPTLTYVLYPLAIIAALWQPRGGSLPNRRTRVALIGLFVLGYLLTIVSLYVAFTPAGSLAVAGVQGRYFTVVMPLLFIALLLPLGVSGRLHKPTFLPSGLRETAALPPSASGAGGESGPASQIPSVASVAGPAVASAAREAKQPPPRAPIRTKWFQSPQLPWILAGCALLLYVSGLLLSYHVPCGSQYYRLDLCYQPQYKNWAPQDTSSPAIGPSMILTQEIVARCDNMTDIRVWINSSGTNPIGTTTLSLRAPTEEKDVVTQTYSNSSISSGGWLTARFPVEPGSLNRLYQLKLAGSSPDGVRVGYSGEGEYLDGKLFENEQPMTRDILFQYGCISGLRAALAGR
jgi:hypothetical protein